MFSKCSFWVIKLSKGDRKGGKVKQRGGEREKGGNTSVRETGRGKESKGKRKGISDKIEDDSGRRGNTRNDEKR